MKLANFVLAAITAAAVSFGAQQSKSGIMFAKAAHDPRNDTRIASPPSNQQDRDREQDSRPNHDEYPTIRLPEGTVVPIRMADDVNSNHDKPGTMFTGTVDPSVLINNTVVIPRGTEAHIRMVEAKKGGHIKGKAKVRLELTSLIINGQRLGVDTDAPSKNKGAAGAKSSAVAKSGAKSSGAVSNGGVGYGVAGPVIAAFSAAKVEVKAGSRVDFTLESPFTFEKPPVNNNSGQ